MSENIEKALKAYDEKNFYESFNFFEAARKEMAVEEFDRVYSFKFIRTIYETIVKNTKDIDNNSKKWIIYIMVHLKNKDLFYKLTVFKIVDILLKKNNNVDYSKVITWLEKLDPNLLSEDQKSFESNGKVVLMSSEKEKYYAHLSKAYEKIKDYKKSKKVSIEALKNLKIFTNDSNIWFNRRIAEGHIAEGFFEEALSIYKEIMKRKNDWFILKEVSDIYFKMGDHQKGKNYIFDAISAPGEIDKKLNLFLDLYNYFQLLDKKIATDSLKIYFKIKLEQDWNINSKDKEIAALENIELSKEQLVKVSSRKFIEKCKKLRWQNEPIYKGTVDSINEKFFFIKSENGERYYCKVKDYPERKPPLMGISLEFNLIETFDAKKNRYSLSAVNLSFEKYEGII